MCDGRGDLWTVLIAGGTLADVRFESWRFGWLARGLSLCVFWLLDGGGVVDCPLWYPPPVGRSVVVWMIGLLLSLLFRAEWE